MSSELSSQLTYLYGLERFGIKMGLEVMQQLLAELGNPERELKSIHITGTNGKGSTASFINSVLVEQGLKVGLYTSPHLYRFNERISIAGHAIPDEALLTLIARVRRVTESKKITATFFEFTTALAFLYFAEANVDIAVIEVGMGGELDATNVITPLAAVITNIGLDHVPILGNNKAEITANKAGIIKQGCDVVTAETDAALVGIMQDVGAKMRTMLYEVDKEITVTDRQQSLEGQTFSVSGCVNSQLKIALLGKHQVRNACTALVVLWRLQQRGWNITDESIARGLASASWPGRLDIVSRDPFILIDGAHNNDGVESLSAFLNEMKDELPEPSVLVVAAKKDKNITELRDGIVAQFPKVVATQGNYEPMPAHELATALAGGSAIEAIVDVSEALKRAEELVTPNGMILITGSLYMVGDALISLREKTL